MSGSRNPAVDVYRCIIMFGVCLLHAITQGGHNQRYVANCLLWCVPAFAFVSGWFGVRFSTAKLIKLYLNSLYCSVMLVLITVTFTDLPSYGGGGYIGALRRVWNLTIGNWYLNAYAVMMCFAPLIESSLSGIGREMVRDKKALVKPFLPLIFVSLGWGFVLAMPHCQSILPSTPGLTPYSFVTLTGVYIVARILQKCDCEKFVCNHRKLSCIVGFVCLVFLSVGFGKYNSPIGLVFIIITFCLIKSLKFSVSLNRIGICLAPSMFSVYLLHSNSCFFEYVALFEDFLLGLNLPLCIVYMVTASVIFLLGVICDIPRRLFVRYVK